MRLISDLHIDAANTDHGRIREELQEAKRLGDRILVNGDVFDAIIPKDIKRARQSSQHPRLQGKDDVMGEALDWAEEIFDPVREQLYMIGVGNHEDSIIKYHGFDPTHALISRLQRNGSPVVYGDYCGWIIQRFDIGNARQSWHCHYHHGGGGNSPVTKGIIGFQRKSSWIDGADCIWEGHKHNRIIDWHRIACAPNASGYVSNYDRLHVMSGGYMDIQQGYGQTGGRKSQYAEDWGVGPQSKGGWRVVLKPKWEYPDGKKGARHFRIEQKIEG